MGVLRRTDINVAPRCSALEQNEVHQEREKEGIILHPEHTNCVMWKGNLFGVYGSVDYFGDGKLVPITIPMAVL